MKPVLSPRRRAWLLWGAGLGALVVLLAHAPRWQAWWAWWQREPLPQSAGMPAPAPASMAVAAWEQRLQGLAEARDAPDLWRALRVQLAAHGLAVQQWQQLEGAESAGAGKAGQHGPLAVQGARLVLKGPPGAWPLLPASAAPAGGLWRLERLDGQVQAEPSGTPVWRWQAQWTLALRPSDPSAPGTKTAVSATEDAAPVSAPAFIPPPLIAPALIAPPLTPERPAAPSPMTTAALASSAAVAATAAPGDGPQSAQALPTRTPQVHGQGLAITDWPLAQLQWVGLWSREDLREAVFSAPGRLFRVRPGEAVGQEGYRWTGGDAHRLVLQLPAGSDRARTGERAQAPVQKELIWGSRP